MKHYSVFLLSLLVVIIIPIFCMDDPKTIPTTDYILTMMVKSIPIVSDDADSKEAIEEIKKRLKSTNYMPVPINKCKPLLIKALQLWKKYYANPREVYLRDAISTLITSDIHVNQVDKKQRLPLIVAFKAFRYAIDNSKTDKDGKKIIAMEESVSALINKTVNVNKITITGKTALMKAFRYLVRHKNNLVDKTNLLCFCLNLIKKDSDILIQDQKGYCLIKDISRLYDQFSENTSECEEAASLIIHNNKLGLELMEKILIAHKGQVVGYYTSLDRLINKINEKGASANLLADYVLPKVLEYETDLNYINANEQTPLIRIIDNLNLVYYDEQKVDALLHAFKSIIKKGADINFCYERRSYKDQIEGKQKITSLTWAKKNFDSPTGDPTKVRPFLKQVINILKEKGAKEVEELTSA